ncbi:hypothetical protein ADIARSV_2797 [Arcticibacter svalbardensis MN12-7]|uniref:Uncharacterized protein n=1 Tax=Arcticibacter svalbardensis MN12-7 TaxID=1150600 RepID=R9GQG7_9SPHI|nr:hypothetical protein [Arcticibacter svalbardensis]EOR93963.1 hypothetical protein ADIARSV_2797 [Arcticibacter svalbardensis MN12-7]
MKKTLNDSLREEFGTILKQTQFANLIIAKKIDPTIISGAFEKLLSADRFLEAELEDIDKARGEFENYIINTIKTKRHSNGN